MTRHTDSPLRDIRLSPTTEPFSQLVRQEQRGTIDLNPPYQRDLVWTLDQKIALIRSLIGGTPVPAIITNRRTHNMAGTRYVVDGKQRITAFAEFMNSDFMVPASWFDPVDVLTVTPLTGVLVEVYGDTGDYVAFKDLSEAAQAGLENAAVPVAEGRFKTVQEEAEVYLRVNGFGTPQTDSDMANAARVAGR